MNESGSTVPMPPCEHSLSARAVSHFMMLSPRFGMNATPFAATLVRYSESGNESTLSLWFTHSK